MVKIKYPNSLSLGLKPLSFPNTLKSPYSPASSLFYWDNGNKKSSTSADLTPVLFLQIQLSSKNCLKFSNHISHCSRMTYFALEWTSEFIHINNYLQTLLFKIWTGIRKKKRWRGAVVTNEGFSCLTIRNKTRLPNLDINVTFKVFGIFSK